MDKEKEKPECLTYLWDLAWFQIFMKWAERMIANSKEWEREWYAVMNGWMFHKQTHICKTWKDLWRKIKHNKEAKKLCEICNYPYE